MSTPSPLMVKASVSRNRSPVSFTTGLFLSMSVHIQKKRREERVDGEREEKNDDSKGRATNRFRKKRVKVESCTNEQSDRSLVERHCSIGLSHP